MKSLYSRNLGRFAAALLACAGSLTVCAQGGLPVFPYAGGWLGADAAYSVPLGPGHSVWLFGDTFAGRSAARTRAATTMVRNSVGLSDCTPGKACTMHYYWRKQKTAKPRSFFDSGREDVWYWPLDGFFDGHALYLVLTEVRNRPNAEKTDALGFEITGTRWARVSNPLAPPNAWHVEMQPLTTGNLMPGVSIVADGDFLLLYTEVDEGQGKGYTAVIRVPLAHLDEPLRHCEYFGQDHAWHSGLPAQDALRVIDQPISEMSVRYHPSIRKWVAVSFAPGFLTHDLVTRTADSAVGPWTEPEKFYAAAEMIPTQPHYDRETFCYAAKEHIEFGEDRLVVTYVCNSFSFDKVTRDLGLYRPEIVTVPLPR